MIDAPKVAFSDRDQAPTALEEWLLLHGDDRHPFVMIGKKIGAKNLAVVLDCLGGEKPHVPDRKSFYKMLWLPWRNAEIRKLRLCENVPLEKIAVQFGITVQACCLVISRTTVKG